MTFRSLLCRLAVVLVVAGGIPTTAEAQVVGCALSFDGNDYVEAPEGGSLSFTDDYTLATWAKFDAISGDQALIGRSPGAGQAGHYYLHINGNPDLALHIPYVSVVISVGVALSGDVWYHMVAVKEGTTYTVYLNGGMITSVVDSATPVTSGVVRIGGIVDNQFITGDMDDVRIYNRALNDSEISQIYNSGAGSASNSISDLVGWWKFDGGSGGTAVDSSGFGNHATINGATWIGSCEPASSSASSSGSTPVPEFSTWAMIVALGLCGWELHRRGLLPDVLRIPR